MKAGVVYAPHDIRYTTIEKPTPKEHDVLIKVKYTGICGSDVPRVNANAAHFFPNVFGHEFSGVVEAVGSHVTHVSVGDRVAGVPLVPCMECADCQQGNYSLCKHYSFIGSRQFGSFAEYVVVPERNAVKISDDVSFEQAALFEPATIALHGIQRVRYEGGGTVAILGGGPIGLLTMQFAKLFGAAHVVVFDIDDDRLATATKLGADGVINTLADDFKDKARALTDGKGFDYLFETAGAIPTMKLVYELAANKAQACYIGTPKKEISFSVDEWENLNRKEMTITGSWMSYSAPFPGREWHQVAHFFATGQLSYEGIIFKTFPLSSIDEAFALYEQQGAVKGKILIDSEH